MRRAALFAPTALVVATVLAGCGTSLDKESATRAGPSTSGVTETTAGAISAVDSISATTRQAKDQCTAADLQPSWSGTGNDASGIPYYVINLVNRSATSCVTGGYADIDAFDTEGSVASLSRSANVGVNPPPTFSIGPGSWVHFIVGFPAVDLSDGGSGCSTTVGALQLTLPGETTDLQIATPVGPGYPSLCDNTFPVGPIEGGAIDY